MFALLKPHQKSLTRWLLGYLSLCLLAMALHATAVPVGNSLHAGHAASAQSMPVSMPMASMQGDACCELDLASLIGHAVDLSSLLLALLLTGIVLIWLSINTRCPARQQVPPRWFPPPIRTLLCCLRN